jgi:hypothetical protein
MFGAIPCAVVPKVGVRSITNLKVIPRLAYAGARRDRQ